MPVPPNRTRTENGDAAGNTNTNARVAVNETFHGTLEGAGDRSDWIAVNLQGGQTYTVALVGIGALDDRLEDPYLRIRDDNGSQVAFNDDDNRRDSAVTFTPSSTGTYYIDARAWNDASDGDYGVSVVRGTEASYDIEMGAGAILSGNTSWNSSPGQQVTVTWAIRDTLVNDPANNQNTTEPLSGRQTTAVVETMTYIDDVLGANIQRVNDGSGRSDNATILFGAYDLNDGAGAYAFLPGNAAAGAVEGDVWLNNSGGSGGPTGVGTFVNYVILHEVGHALGLEHPSDYNAGIGQNITYEKDARFIQDSQQYTVMSYFAPSDSGGSRGIGYPDTFLLFDYEALHELYGANPNYNAGNTVYGFNATKKDSAYDFTENDDPFLTVYDAGGTDWIDLSGYDMTQNLKLKDGVLSDVGGFEGNFSIAKGTVIENAKGGSGNDKITGNRVDNIIEGRAGSDTLQGGNGNDTILGGTGRDQIFGGSGTDTASYKFSGAAVRVNLAANTASGGHANGDTFSSIEILVGSRFNDVLTGNSAANRLEGLGGRDTLNGGNGNDTLEGGAGSDNLNGGGGRDVASYRDNDSAGATVNLSTNRGSGQNASGDKFQSIEDLNGSDFGDDLTGNGANNNIHGYIGDDEINGLSGRDTLRGGNGRDEILAGGGNDVVWGGAGIDSIFGGAGNDSLSGGNSDDIISSGAGRDTVKGDAGNDKLTGNSGNDSLEGGTGNDTINGGTGNDVMIGGGNADTFVFRAGDGNDRIKDFSNGQDMLRFNGIDPSDVTVTQGSGGAVVNYGAGTVILEGVNASVIDADDFQFG